MTYDMHPATTSVAKSRSAYWRLPSSVAGSVTGSAFAFFAFVFWLIQLSTPAFAQTLGVIDNTITTQNTEGTSPTTDPLFLVTNVLVRGSGAGSAEARKRAFELAHIAGLRTVVGRLTSQSERFTLRLPDLETLTAMVELIEVHDQRLSDTTLVALMDLKFSKEKVKSYLSQEGIAFSLTKAKPFLVLPLLRVQGQQFGWDRRSPWFRTWETSVLPSGLVTFELPKSESDFNRALDLIKSGAQNQLQELIGQLGAGALLLAEASVSLNDQGGLDSITVDVLRFAGKTSGQIGQSTLRYNAPVEAGDDVGSVFAKAAENIASTYNRAWKSQSSTLANQISELEFETEIEGLDSWLELEQILNNVGLIELVDLRSLSDTQVIARLEFNGSLDQLSAALGQQGIDLIPSVQRFFLVR